MSQKTPKAVLISDIHFTLKTLDLATYSLVQALSIAIELNVPLIIAGDTLNDKALMRAEIVNRLIEIFNTCDYKNIYMLVGNHDLINEKGREHTLNFLSNYINIIKSPVEIKGLYLYPYFSDPSALSQHLEKVIRGSTIIMHQGVQGAFMGDYVIDKTSLPKEVFADYRVISGHYHRAQNIKCGRPRKGGIGLFSYIGNPYTLTFGEANDGPKGYQILNENGLLTQIPLNLRKHVIAERTIETIGMKESNLKPEDLLWLKVTGTESELSKIKKQEIGMEWLGHTNFKLDKIVLQSDKPKAKTEGMKDEQIFDLMIDDMNEEDGQKRYLKKLWREVI